MMDDFYTQQAANSPFVFNDMRQELDAFQRGQTATPGAAPQQNIAAANLFTLYNPVSALR
jgi:hypothetical protein